MFTSVLYMDNPALSELKNSPTHKYFLYVLPTHNLKIHLGSQKFAQVCLQA